MRTKENPAKDELVPQGTQGGAQGKPKENPAKDEFVPQGTQGGAQGKPRGIRANPRVTHVHVDSKLII